MCPVCRDAQARANPTPLKKATCPPAQLPTPCHNCNIESVMERGPKPISAPSRAPVNRGGVRGSRVARRNTIIDLRRSRRING